MSKRPVLSILLALALAATSFHVDAKRLGGGKSFGRQSTHVTQRNAANPVGGTGTAAGMQQNAHCSIIRRFQEKSDLCHLLCNPPNNWPNWPPPSSTPFYAIASR